MDVESIAIVINAVGIVLAVEVSELSSALLLTLETSLTEAEKTQSLLFLVRHIKVEVIKQQRQQTKRKKKTNDKTGSN